MFYPWFQAVWLSLPSTLYLQPSIIPLSALFQRVLQITLWIELEHVFLHPLVGLNRSEFPTAVACRDNLDERAAFAGHRSLEGFADGFLGTAYGWY